MVGIELAASPSDADIADGEWPEVEFHHPAMRVNGRIWPELPCGTVGVPDLPPVSIVTLGPAVEWSGSGLQWHGPGDYAPSADWRVAPAICTPTIFTVNYDALVSAAMPRFTISEATTKPVYTHYFNRLRAWQFTQNASDAALAIYATYSGLRHNGWQRSYGGAQFGFGLPSAPWVVSETWDSRDLLNLFVRLNKVTARRRWSTPGSNLSALRRSAATYAGRFLGFTRAAVRAVQDYLQSLLPTRTALSSRSDHAADEVTCLELTHRPMRGASANLAPPALAA